MTDWERLHSRSPQRHRGQPKVKPRRREFETFYPTHKTTKKPMLDRAPHRYQILTDVLYHECGFTTRQISEGLGYSTSEVQRAVSADSYEKIQAYGSQHYLANQNKINAYSLAYSNAKYAESDKYSYMKWKSGYGNPRPRAGEEAKAWTIEEDARVFAMWCERRKLEAETGIAHELDHIKPYDTGGRHHPDNLRVVTKQFNSERPKDGSDEDNLWEAK